MGHLRLSTLLVIVNVGLLLLAVAGVAVIAVRLLEQLADEQALARVSQANRSAFQALEHTSQHAEVAARTFAEQPQLPQLLAPPLQQAELNALLDQVCGERFDACAILRDEQVLASNADILWSLPTSSERFGRLLMSPQDGPLVLGAWAAVPTSPDVRVVVGALLDSAFCEWLSDEIGLTVLISKRQSIPISVSDARSLALRTQQLAANRSNQQELYRAALPLLAPTGEALGVIETQLPTMSISETISRFSTTLIVLTLSLTAIAALISVVLGKQLGAPLRSLTAAATRIGSGDLSTPITLAPGAEIGRLAMALEEMRVRLQRLTADLRREQAEAHTVVTGIIEGVFTVDRERRIRYLNPQAAAMLGLDEHAVLGRFCGEVLWPQGPSGVRPCEEHCPIVHARFRGGARATEHLLLEDGRRRTVVITSAPVFEGRQVQIMRDETEIEATRRLRDTVLANISHEFKTPLSAQLASIELLLDQLPDLSTEQIGDLVLALQRGTLRLTQLIDNLLESARIEAGHDALHFQPVALDQVIEDALELTRPLLDQRKQQVVMQLPYPLPLVPGDALRLTQVFVNLLANANKFAPPQSTISIGGEVGEQTITLWIEDQGPGLPLDAGPVLFSRFVRAPAEDTHQSGVGLGLWIVKSIVERHHGQVTASSNRNGLRMCVTLPKEKPHEDPGR
jgi:signal transduction histidine kinase